MDEGQPSSWQLLEPGTAVFASDGAEVGSVKEVLAVPEEDIFLHTHQGDRFAQADLIGSIHDRGVDLELDAAGAASLPAPEPAPATMEVGPDVAAEPEGAYKRDIWLKRAWNRLTGNY